ncbi:MAG: hypothetical protein RBR68_07540 [Tenuifilaceae bacterium]|nr:hypothetical protein [Tenuifilaceae bacterium]
MVKSNQTVTTIFVTIDPDTGANVDASNLPTGTLYINTVVNAATVTIAKIDIGTYSATVTLPALLPGDNVSLVITATVGTITASGVVWADTADTKYISDLNDISASTPMTLTPAERTAIANEVESQIINDTDSERVLQAIVDKIASANPSLEDLTLLSIASAVRTELTTELERIDQAISTRLAALDYSPPPTDYAKPEDVNITVPEPIFAGTVTSPDVSAVTLAAEQPLYPLVKSTDIPTDYAKEDTLDNLILAVNASQNDLVLINKWILNRLDKQDNPDGTYNLVLYDDDSTTILKTWVVDPATGVKTKAI